MDSVPATSTQIADPAVYRRESWCCGRIGRWGIYDRDRDLDGDCGNTSIASRVRSIVDVQLV